MTADHELQEDELLIEAWSLVDELGAHSLRLRRAAIAARQALGLPTEEEDPA